jgi:hypothetical protein
MNVVLGEAFGIGKAAGMLSYVNDRSRPRAV